MYFHYKVKRLLCHHCGKELQWDYKNSSQNGVVFPCENCTDLGKENKAKLEKILKDQ